jgi:hypothetical protein
MGDREYYLARAVIERAAAMNSVSSEGFHAHMAMVREYEWLAATEPYEDETRLPPLAASLR